MEVQFFPYASGEIIYESLICDYEFACIIKDLPDTDTAPPNSTPFVLHTIVNVCPKRGCGISPLIFIFSQTAFFILDR